MSRAWKALTRKILTKKEEEASYLNSSIIEIRVGSKNSGELRHFYVHEELLTRRSPFFANAFKGYTTHARYDSNIIRIVKWKEGEAGSIWLPGDDVDVFAAYVQLIYYDKLPIYLDPEKTDVPYDAREAEEKDAEELFDAQVLSAVDHEYEVLSKLYVYCDKILDLDGKKSVLQGFVEAALKTRANDLVYCCSAVTITYLYENTVPSDAIRDFLADCYVFKGCTSWVFTGADAYHHEFLRDVMIGMLKHRPQPRNIDRLEDSDYYTNKIKTSRTNAENH